MAKTFRFLLMLLTIFVAVMCLFFLVVPFLGFGWHMLHRNYISDAGWKIPIPKHYYVRQQERGPTVWKPSFGAPLFDVPFSHISFFSRKPGAEIFMGTGDSARFEQAISETATQNGYQLKSKHIVPIGNKNATCLEFERVGKQPKSLVRCAAEDANVYPFFEGDVRYIPELFAMLKGMS